MSRLDDPAISWLEHFDHSLVPLPGDHIAVPDEFTGRDDRPAAIAADDGHTELQDPVPSACDGNQTHVPVTVAPPEHNAPTPRCHGLQRFTIAVPTHQGFHVCGFELNPKSI